MHFLARMTKRQFFTESFMACLGGLIVDIRTYISLHVQAFTTAFANYRIRICAQICTRVSYSTRKMAIFKLLMRDLLLGECVPYMPALKKLVHLRCAFEEPLLPLFGYPFVLRHQVAVASCCSCCSTCCCCSIVSPNTINNERTQEDANATATPMENSRVLAATHAAVRQRDAGGTLDVIAEAEEKNIAKQADHAICIKATTLQKKSDVSAVSCSVNISTADNPDSDDATQFAARTCHADQCCCCKRSRIMADANSGSNLRSTHGHDYESGSSGQNYETGSGSLHTTKLKRNKKRLRLVGDNSAAVASFVSTSNSSRTQDERHIELLLACNVLRQVKLPAVERGEVLFFTRDYLHCVEQHLKAAQQQALLELRAAEQRVQQKARKVAAAGLYQDRICDWADVDPAAAASYLDTDCFSVSYFKEQQQQQLHQVNDMISACSKRSQLLLELPFHLGGELRAVLLTDVLRVCRSDIEKQVIDKAIGNYLKAWQRRRIKSAALLHAGVQQAQTTLQKWREGSKSKQHQQQQQQGRRHQQRQHEVEQHQEQEKQKQLHQEEPLWAHNEQSVSTVGCGVRRGHSEGRLVAVSNISASAEHENAYDSGSNSVKTALQKIEKGIEFARQQLTLCETFYIQEMQLRDESGKAESAAISEARELLAADCSTLTSMLLRRKLQLAVRFLSLLVVDSTVESGDTSDPAGAPLYQINPVAARRLSKMKKCAFVQQVQARKNPTFFRDKDCNMKLRSATNLNTEAQRLADGIIGLLYELPLLVRVAASETLSLSIPQQGLLVRWLLTGRKEVLLHLKHRRFKEIPWVDIERRGLRRSGLGSRFTLLDLKGTNDIEAVETAAGIIARLNRGVERIQ